LYCYSLLFLITKWLIFCSVFIVRSLYILVSVDLLLYLFCNLCCSYSRTILSYSPMLCIVNSLILSHLLGKAVGASSMSLGIRSLLLFLMSVCYNRLFLYLLYCSFFEFTDIFFPTPNLEDNGFICCPLDTSFIVELFREWWLRKFIPWGACINFIIYFLYFY